MDVFGIPFIFILVVLTYLFVFVFRVLSLFTLTVVFLSKDCCKSNDHACKGHKWKTKYGFESSHAPKLITCNMISGGAEH